MTDQTTEQTGTSQGITRRRLLKGGIAVAAGLAAASVVGCAPDSGAAQAQKSQPLPTGPLPRETAPPTDEQLKAEANFKIAKELAEKRKNEIISALFNPDPNNPQEIKFLDFDLVAASDESTAVKCRPIPLRLGEDQISFKVEPGEKMIIPRPIIIEEPGLVVEGGERGYWIVFVSEDAQVHFMPITKYNIDYLSGFSKAKNGQPAIEPTKLTDLGVNPYGLLPERFLKQAMVVKPLTYKVGDKYRANDPENPEQPIKVSIKRDQRTIDEMVKMGGY